VGRVVGDNHPTQLIANKKLITAGLVCFGLYKAKRIFFFLGLYLKKSQNSIFVINLLQTIFLTTKIPNWYTFNKFIPNWYTCDKFTICLVFVKFYCQIIKLNDT